MPVPTCPNCGEPVERILDLAYGYWQWEPDAERFAPRTCSERVDVSPWVHDSCMGELRDLHPQNDYRSAAASSG
jgi:hypothetical protein